MKDERFVIRCPVNLVEKVDEYIKNGEYMNRGDAGRDLIRLGIQAKEFGHYGKK